jgi:hypothetical protein
MVSEDDAAALVVRVATLLKLDGFDPVITAENAPWLVRDAARMLDRLGIGTGRETTEESDG